MSAVHEGKEDIHTPLGEGDRIAVIDAARTPFAKAWNEYKDWSEADLGRAAVNELINRVDVDPDHIDEVIFGCVSAPTNGPNVAREVVLRTPIPREVPAYTTQMYCASSAMAAVNACGDILSGAADVAVVGGVDSASASQARVSLNMTQALNDASRARSPMEILEAFEGVGVNDLVPQTPAIAEPTTGQRMGDSGEVMAKEYGVGRDEQDKFAERSHHRAAKAYDEGRLPDVTPVIAGENNETPLERDPLLRPDTSVEQMAKLSPAFDKKHGTITAANATPLTDGGSSVMLMRESKAEELGLEPQAFIRAHAIVGVDLFEEPMLMGPTYATPKVLDHSGLEFDDLDLIEMHEAFAAQTLVNLKVWQSDELCQELGLDGKIGDVDMDDFNPNGGSVAMGHPFGATGARLIGQTAHEMVDRDDEYGLLTACAAGGLGISMILER